MNQNFFDNLGDYSLQGKPQGSPETKMRKHSFSLFSICFCIFCVNFCYCLIITKHSDCSDGDKSCHTVRACTDSPDT